MFEKLAIYLNKKHHFTEAELTEIQPYVFQKTFSKGDFILKEGGFCHFIGFLDSGLIRCWLVDESGKEITTQFVFEDCFFTYLEGLEAEISSHKNFMAIEDCTVLMLQKIDLPKILSINPKFEVIFRQLLLEDTLLQMQAIESERKESPQERYLKFLEQNPSATQRIPIKYIASYLGIEPQSLSRIRRRIAQHRK